MPIAAISSSAWITAYVARPVAGSRRCFSRFAISASITLDDGVIGYHDTTVTPPNIVPSAAAVLPSIRIFPAVAFMRSSAYGTLVVTLAFAHSRPAATACRFRSSAFGLWPSCASSARSISSASIPISSASTPT